MRERKRSASDVAIVLNEDESQAVLEGLRLINARPLIQKDDVVVITPNWVQKKHPDSGVVVGHETLRTVIRFVKAQNPKRVVVATGSGGGNTREVMSHADFDQVIGEEKVEFVDLNEGPFVRVELGHQKPSATDLNSLFQEMTCLISFTQLKMHEEATVSGTIKNMALSWPPSKEHGTPKKKTGIHEDLHGFIVAMAEKITIDLSILSAQPAMIGTGPGKGLARHTGLVVIGTDPVSVDTLGARLLGLKPQGVRYLYEAGKKGLGETDILRMNLYGLPLIEAEKEFSQRVYGASVSVDAD